MWPVEFSLAHGISRGLFAVQPIQIFYEKLAVLYHLAADFASTNLQNWQIFKGQRNLLVHWNLHFQVSSGNKRALKSGDSKALLFSRGSRIRTRMNGFGGSLTTYLECTCINGFEEEAKLFPHYFHTFVLSFVHLL